MPLLLHIVVLQVKLLALPVKIPSCTWKRIEKMQKKGRKQEGFLGKSVDDSVEDGEKCRETRTLSKKSVASRKGILTKLWAKAYALGFSWVVAGA